MINNKPMVTKTKKQEKVYSSEKAYTWEPDDIFALDGNEFGLIYQSLKNELYLPQGLSIKQKLDAFNVIEVVLKRHYESGVGKEFIPPIKENN